MTQHQQPEESEFETQWWELDSRSLAVLRVALGSFVLLTLASFWGDTAAFFTDAGVLPREALVRSGLADLWLCFHLGSGSWHTQVLLNTMLGAFAVGLVVGWRTPWMVAGCWVLLNSLQVRNPFVGDRGDLELSLILFWAFFLPLGSRWSLDARAGRAPFGQARGIAAAALVTQFGLIYLFAAYLKEGEFWLTRGDGLYHSLISPLFSTKLSLWLADSGAGMLSLGNYAVVAGEFFVGMLLLCPWSVGLVRSLAVAILVVFHVSVGVVFQLGLFPWIGALLPLALLPAEFWQGWGRRIESLLDGRFGMKDLQETPPRYKFGRDLFIGAALVLALLSCFVNTPKGREWAAPRWTSGLTDGLRLTQHWELFSPIPPYYGTFALRTVKPDGTSQDFFHGPPTREKPELQAFPSHRWRMLMIATLYPHFQVVRPGVAEALARRAGADPASQQGVEYSFFAEIPNEKGALQPAVEWKLWQQPAKVSEP